MYLVLELEVISQYHGSFEIRRRGGQIANAPLMIIPSPHSSPMYNSIQLDWTGWSEEERERPHPIISLTQSTSYRKWHHEHAIFHSLSTQSAPAFRASLPAFSVRTPRAPRITQRGPVPDEMRRGGRGVSPVLSGRPLSQVRPHRKSRSIRNEKG